MENQQELEQKNITISGIEDVKWGIKLKSETGEVYNVSKNLKDGSAETKAFQVLKTLPGYGMGMIKSVKFATVPNSQGGQSRYVRIIGEAENNVAEPINNATPTPKIAPTPQILPKIGYVAQNQSEDIRANVALKMVSEILAAGVVPITDWQKWADNFYNYKPNTNIKANLEMAGINTKEVDISEIRVDEIPF